MFEKARLKLTTQYLAIITLISFSFSFSIYNVLTGEVDRVAHVQQLRFARRMEINGLPLEYPPAIDQDIVNDVHHRVFLFLLLINSGVLIASGGLGYLLAGRTLKPIAEMVEEQNRFISDSSHELRTPLTSLKSAFEVNLRDKKLTLKGAKILIAESVDEVNKLQSLSDQLLELARYQNHQSNLRFESKSLKKIVDITVSKINRNLVSKKIKLTSRISNIQIDTYNDSLSELLIILLDNAIKYSEIGKIITLSAKVLDGKLKLTISDQGVGISEVDLPHIFDRFYRADSARSRSDIGGYGLGLSIAKKIVESHRGTIAVISQVGIGTIFTIRLPIHQS